MSPRSRLWGGRKETKNEEAGAVELKGIFSFFFSAFGINIRNEKEKKKKSVKVE
jgi:hypothetical protein